MKKFGIQEKLLGKFGVIKVETKRIVITGANGFLGSNLTRFFLKKGYDVHITVRKSSDLWRIKEIIAELSVSYLNKSSKEEFEDVIQFVKPDTLINAIGADQKKYIRDESSTWFGNIDCLVNITRSLKNWTNISLIQLGSSFEYGRTTLINNPVNENTICEPVSEYGITKLLSTEYLRYLGMNEILYSASVRIFNVYGQFESPERLIPDIVIKNLTGSKVILKNPKVSRDFIHVDDVVEVIRLLVEKQNYINENKFDILNVGTGMPHTVEEVANYILKNTASRMPIETNQLDNRPENSYPGPIADIQKIKKSLGWKPRFTLEDGLKDTVDWFKKHAELYKNL